MIVKVDIKLIVRDDLRGDIENKFPVSRSSLHVRAFETVIDR